jgi:anthranilate/para-aminobenzoate synthase component I
VTLVARLLDLPPDPFDLARRLADRPGAVLLGTGFGEGSAFVTCDPCDEARALDPEPGLGRDPLGAGLAHVPRWIGLLPYEARRSLERPGITRRQDRRATPHLPGPRWLRYGAVAVVDDRVLVVGDDSGAVRRLSDLLARPGRVGPATLELFDEVEPAAWHEGRVRAALDLIAAGDLYQVNLARRFRLRATGSPVDLLAALGPTGSAPYSAALSLDDAALVSASPELFLALGAEGRLITSPIKGTRPRGRDAESDADLARDLDLDPKERAELTMVVDVERNDLGRVARVGSVRLLEAPRVQTLPTVHHRLATVAAQLRPEVGRTELLEAMLPSGSVTGAPKVRAMEVIAELEAERRGLYTGAFGTLCHDGSLRLAMAIRTLTLQHGVAHYWVGGGIVADSDPRREVEETLWKARALAALCSVD